MDHQEATRIQAPGRYALGDLTPSEREGFEEHFFTCPECAEELRADAIFADNARAVFHDDVPRASSTSPARSPQRGAGWWSWLRPAYLIPATAALALVCAYQNIVTIPRLRGDLGADRAPQSLTTFPLRAAFRGDDQVLTVPKSARYWSVFFDLADQGPAFVCELRDAHGILRASLMVNRVPGQDSLSLLLDASQFPAGPYILTVKSPGDNGGELGRYRFSVTYQ